MKKDPRNVSGLNLYENYSDKNSTFAKSSLLRFDFYVSSLVAISSNKCSIVYVHGCKSLFVLLNRAMGLILPFSYNMATLRMIETILT